MGRRMTSIKLRYIKEYSRNGKTYRYFRRKGLPSVLLPGLPGSRAFNEAYQAALTEKPIPVGPDAPGTMGRLICDYYGSVDFANLKPSSKRSYRVVLEHVRTNHGHRMVSEMPADKASDMIEKIGRTRPGMANLARAVMKLLFKFATRKRMKHQNPFDGIASYKIGTRHTWTDEQLKAFEKRWEIGTQQRLDYASLLFSGQRGGDVTRMVRPSPKATTIKVVQEKTGVELTIPIHPEWRKAIDAVPAKGLSLIGNANGRPISRGVLTWRIRKAAKAAGLPPECKAHGLRKALMRILAEAGNSSKRIAAMSGHKTLKEIERYTDAADQQRLAEEAMSNSFGIRHSRLRK